jgi:nucleoside-diphosphate-sugar epimerase
MKRVFITGATGFLGSNLAKKLATQGHQVTASGRNLAKGQDLKNLGIDFISLDLSQKESFKSLGKDFDWVFHCAALSSPWGSYQDFFKANVLATQNILEHFANDNNIERLIYVSSPSVYTDLEDKLNIKEDSALPKINLNHYIKTKKMCEILVDRYVKEFKMPVITIRPQGIIGPGDPSIFPRLLKIAQKGFLPKIGKGKTTLDLTYIDNVVHGLICAAQADSKYLGEKYNITNDEPIELYSTLEKIMAELDIKFKWKNLSQRKALFIGRTLENVFSLLPKRFEPPLTRYSVCTLAFNRTLDLTKAKNELNYKPIVSMHKALELSVLNMKKDLQGG